MLAILAAAILYPATVVSVPDGDTIKVHVSGWPAPFDPISVRVYGIDAPEHQRPPAKSACEVKLGLRAQAYARTLVHPGDVVTLRYDPAARDKYLRVLAGVTLPDGSDFAQRMTAAGMARPYGGAASLTKGAWCAKGKPIPLQPGDHP